MAEHQGNIDMLRAAAADAASAIISFQRGLAFYEADHPVVQQQERDADAAIRVWQVTAGGDTWVAAAGRRLTLTGLEDGTQNTSDVSFCDLLVRKSVIGFHLPSPVDIKQVRRLLKTLGEAERRVRASGGVAKILDQLGARDIDVYEVDLDELMAGGQVDSVGLPPLVADALQAVLALKQGEERKGETVALTLERVSSPESLGSLLDEMIDGAPPEVRDPSEVIGGGTAGGTGPLTGLNADELADLAAEAYGKVNAVGNKSPEALAEAAQVLSSSLVRLSPEARFKLLQKIASTQDAEAAAAVGKTVPNSILLGAIAQVVMGNERDSKLASAIGGLLERMRPLERDRQKLLDELDEVTRSGGRPLDSVFTQELNEISANKTFGALDLPFRETRDGLIAAAQQRMGTLGQPEVVVQTFALGEAETRVRRSAALLADMLQNERRVTPATFASVRSILALTSADASLADAGGQIMLALWNRGLRDGRDSPAAQQLADIAASPSGADWCVLLVENLRHLRGRDTAQLLCDYLKSALEAHPAEGAGGRLGQALTWLDRSVLSEMSRRIGEFAPSGVNAIISAAGRGGAASALRAAVTALKSDRVEVKIAAIRAVSHFPDDAVIDFLRRASGADGEAASVQVLYAQRTPADVDRLQRAAIEALGATHSPLAVPALEEILTRTRLLGGGDFDRTRAWAAQALANNGTAKARNAITNGRASRNRSVRAACEAVRA